MSVMSPQYSALLFRAQDVPDETQSPDWSKVSSQDWEQVLTRLAGDHISPESRLGWMQALRGWIKHNVEPQQRSASRDPQSVQRCFGLMRAVAYTLCDWPLIIRLHDLRALMADVGTEPVNDEQTIEYLQLSVAYWQMGQLSRADKFLTAIAPALSKDNPLLDFHEQIQHDMATMPAEHCDLIDGDLQLLPLEEQHLSSFSWVYHDPQIARLCNLPEFDTNEKWFDWLEENQHTEGHTVFAVNHQKWGFIGSVFIAVHNGVGFFYYWLGKDFQGKGFGPRAVNLLLEFATDKLGMKGCYAKVYDDNLPSQTAMQKIGFQRLSFRVAPPYENELYFYLGEAQERLSQGAELTQLIDTMGFEDTLIV